MNPNGHEEKRRMPSIGRILNSGPGRSWRTPKRSGAVLVAASFGKLQHLNPGVVECSKMMCVAELVCSEHLCKPCQQVGPLIKIEPNKRASPTGLFDVSATFLAREQQPCVRGSEPALWEVDLVTEHNLELSWKLDVLPSPTRAKRLKQVFAQPLLSGG